MTQECLLKPVNFTKILWGLDAWPDVYASRIKETRELMFEPSWEEHIAGVFYENAQALILGRGRTPCHAAGSAGKGRET